MGLRQLGDPLQGLPQLGVPRDPFEKLADAAEVHRLTGICPSVAIHIPWDRVDDFGELAQYVGSLNMRIGAKPEPLPGGRLQARKRLQPRRSRAPQGYRPPHRVRRDRTRVGLGDPLPLVRRRHQLRRPGLLRRAASPHARVPLGTYDAMPESMRMLLEYKPFEPAFYHTDLSDWGAALTMCQKLGQRAEVLVDLGHHLQGANIEHIVAILLDEEAGRLSLQQPQVRRRRPHRGICKPFELFLIYVELVESEEKTRIDYMIDQAHNIEPRIEAMILSVMNLQDAYAKALLVDRAKLDGARRSGDVLGAPASARSLQHRRAAPVREGQGRPRRFGGSHLRLQGERLPREGGRRATGGSRSWLGIERGEGHTLHGRADRERKVRRSDGD